MTVKGQVPNSGVAARVETIARNTEGARGVTNDLQVPRQHLRTRRDWRSGPQEKNDAGLVL